MLVYVAAIHISASMKIVNKGVFYVNFIIDSCLPMVKNYNNGEDEDCNVENWLDDLVGAADQHLADYFSAVRHLTLQNKN